MQAAVGVRTRVGDSPDSEKAKDRSLRQQLIRKFHLALKEEQDTATGTGLERAARWRAPARGGGDSKTPEKNQVAGNSANAALAANAVAKAAAVKRKAVYTKASVPNLPEVIAARVTPIRPITIHDFGFIFTRRGLMALLRGSDKFENAMKLFRKRGKKAGVGMGEDSGEEVDE
ncbi:hypothetical protein R3P38DRAFT_2816383 [Favolaschia claudopus]|uniref:Uncharacterized protein n=1 Tax=Favolaschia claudopus TaxID=2862362 RepID=A0AAV9YZ86_9AGAR